MKKAKSFVKKMFSGKSKKSIISILALIQCVILIALTTYSWIESVSSLIIKGDDLPIAGNINYRFDVDEESLSNVDLNSYFRPTALYQMAHASSPDGNNFYFAKSNSSSYRKGDTTDYNTSYYDFDFYVHNETSKSYNYYFEKADMFTVTSDNEILTSEDLNAAEGAFRINVNVGSTTNDSRIYSRDAATYEAVSGLDGNTFSSTTTTKLTNSDYVYKNGANSEDYFVFRTTPGGEDTKVRIKIWFEERDPGYAALSAAKKEALLGATVSINMVLKNSASSFQTFFFDDYSFSIKSGSLGKNVTTESDSKKMFFYYENDESRYVVPMVKTKSPADGVTRWVTATDDGEEAPRISDEIRSDLDENPENGYFFYGTYNSSTGAINTDYKWSFTQPAVNNASLYIFKALSVNNGIFGFGVWDNTPITLMYFRDQAVTATTNAYNIDGYQFINETGQGCLYLNETGNVSTASTRMFYDIGSGLWKGYYPVTETPHFIYLNGASFVTSNIKVKWNAGTPVKYDEVDSEKFIYTALGYKGTNVVASQPSGGSVGVGTWGPTELIMLSTELLDHAINKDYRYKIGLHNGTTETYYYMTRYQNNLQYGAYVPKGSGNSADSYISFQHFKSVTATGDSGTWNSTATVRDGSNKFYATDMAASTSKGQWHIGVFVDGSADNIVYEVLNTVEGSNLEYSIDGGKTYNEMNKLGNDNYRWYTNDFDSTVQKIDYRWTAYPDVPGYNKAIFIYGHNLSDGIYFNITE